MTTKRLLIFDDSDNTPLGYSWKAGAMLVSSMFETTLKCKSWEECIKSLSKLEGKYDQIQFWGHGHPGILYINEQRAPMEFWEELSKITHKNTDVWLKVCNFFCGKKGKEAAARIVKLLNCRLIANTYIVGTWACHSGLHCLSPDQIPLWSDKEGVGYGGIYKFSSPFEPYTVLALAMKAPKWISNK